MTATNLTARDALGRITASEQTTVTATSPSVQHETYGFGYAYELFASNAKDRNYDYDADGRRVRQTHPSNGNTTITVYDAFGRMAAEYSNQAPTGPAGLVYRMADHLGSTRLAMQGSSVLARYDYLPFGERIGSGINSRSALYGSTGSMVISGQDQVVEQQFTAKERDAESGLDYFGARFFMAPAGRFLSPDAPFADQLESEPQSWNLYSYVRNNPLRFIDPTGRACVVAVDGSSYDDSSGGQSCKEVDADPVGGSITKVQYSGGASVALDTFGNPFGFRPPSSRETAITDASYEAADLLPSTKTIKLAAVTGGVVFRGPVRIWTSKRGVSSVRNAFGHWMTHKGDFPNLQNAKQYVEAARDFVANPPTGTLSKIRTNGDTILYHPGTNTFAVKAADGAPRTMFKPRLGLTYFYSQ